MRFLDNVLQDYIDRARAGHGARRLLAPGASARSGLGVMGFHSFLQARGLPFEGAMAKSWNLRDVQAHQARRPTRRRCSSRSSAAPAPTPPTWA